MSIRVQSHANVIKQITSLEGVGVGPPKWRVCGRGLKRSVNEGMTDISNVKVHFKMLIFSCITLKLNNNYLT